MSRSLIEPDNTGYILTNQPKKPLHTLTSVRPCRPNWHWQFLRILAWLPWPVQFEMSTMAQASIGLLIAARRVMFSFDKLPVNHVISLYYPASSKQIGAY